MRTLESAGVVALDANELTEIRGGDFGVSVVLGLGLLAAMGASFAWGYNNLGPKFNEYF